MPNDHRQDPRLERGTINQTEFERFAVKEVQSDESRETSLKQRILGTGIELSADFDETRNI